jgi:putative phage-type endonuclease
MAVCLSDLPPLGNILDSFQLVEITDSKDIEDIRESIQLIIENFMEDNILIQRCKDFESQLYLHIYAVLENIELISDINVEELISEGIYLYTNLISVPRSIDDPTKISPSNHGAIAKRIKILRDKEQPEQRTDEWYKFRWRHLTASSIWKVFESIKTRNQLLYSKCKPIDVTKFSRVNTTSAMHHGQKYEQVSILIYEQKYNTEVEEFGCIEDDDVSYLAASPDGINVDPTSAVYGRLIEVKNPVSREITGIPKKDYWVQMQMQMAVTKLHVCDFVETSFKAYENEEEFLKDGEFTRAEDGSVKGIIVCFHDGKGPVYKYPAVDIDRESFDIWLDAEIENSPNLSWINNTYWRLNKFSCVVVKFNPQWYNKSLGKFKEAWDEILEYRKSTYDHLKPTKRRKKPQQNIDNIDIMREENHVMKIRTQSFDNSCINHNNNN